MHHARAAAADPDRSAIGGAESQQTASSAFFIVASLASLISPGEIKSRTLISIMPIEFPPCAHGTP